jgi:hypothetical protein
MQLRTAIDGAVCCAVLRDRGVKKNNVFFSFWWIRFEIEIEIAAAGAAYKKGRGPPSAAARTTFFILEFQKHDFAVSAHVRF